MRVWETKPVFLETVLHGLKQQFGLLHQREGIHLTDCLLCLRKAYWDKVNPLPPSQEELLYFLLGLGLQETLSSSFKKTPMELDGIILNPDYETEKGTPTELKTTRISRKRLDSFDFPKHWVKQLMGYCYAMGTVEGDLLIFTLIRPELLNYHITFTEEELKENWKDVLAAATVLRSALENKKPPEPNAEDWECESCRYKLRCQVSRKRYEENPT